MNPRNKKVILCGLAALILGLSVAWPIQTFAYERYDSGFQLLPDCALDKGDCTVDDFIQTFVNFAAVGLKVLPYLTMIMMIWAGFNLILAGGNPQKIQEGKKMIGSIVLGIIIILFLAWAWSYFVIFFLTGSAKVFPEYAIWEREWWGGGEGLLITATEGCCVVNDIGCTYTDDTTCANFNSITGTATFHEATTCSAYATTCQNLANPNTCCVPTDGGNNCHSPTGEGCIAYIKTHTWQNNKCEVIAQCK